MKTIYYSHVQPNTQRTKRVMTVHGTGRVTLPPNVVQVHIEVQTENKNLSAAQQENAATMNKVIEALLNFGIENNHIQTESYMITPQYDYIDGEQRFRGYAVSNVIQVTSGFLEKIGAMIDLAVENGANGISNIQFLIADEKDAYENALSEALIDTQKKAQAMARSMHIQIDTLPIKVVEERREETVIPRMFAAKEMSAMTPIEPGELTIRASVTVQFQY